MRGWCLRMAVCDPSVVGVFEFAKTEDGRDDGEEGW